MLEKLLGMLGDKNKKRVGVISGELLEDWQKHSYELNVIKLEMKAKVNAFGLEIFRRSNPDGKNTRTAQEMAEIATEAFREEHAAFITTHEANEQKLKADSKALWERTYLQLGISPAGSYDLNGASGEVFEIVSGGDGNAEGHPFH